MKFQIDEQYLVRCLKELVETPSPVGYYEEVNPVVERLAKELGCQVTYDRKHTPYLTLEGKDNSKSVMVGAHLDTIGMVVRRIDKDGMIRIRQLGGVNFYSAEGESVTIHTRDGKTYTGLVACQSHSTHVFDDARSAARDETTMMVSLDEKVASKEDVLALGICHGDVISMNPRFEYTDKGFIKSRYIDNKGGAAAVFAMVKYMKEHGIQPQYRTLLSFPHYEEIGHGGAYIPPEVEEFIAVDIGLIGPDYNGNEYSVSICVKDFHSPYDRGLTTQLIEQAKKAECDYAVDIFYRYGTDGSAALKAGNHVRTAALGMAVYCSHGVERTHISGLDNTVNLLIAYVAGL